MCMPLKTVFSRHEGDGVQITDEPTGNLDSRNTVEVRGLLKNSCKKYNQTMMMVTNIERLDVSCDRILHIDDGRLLNEIEGE